MSFRAFGRHFIVSSSAGVVRGVGGNEATSSKTIGSLESILSPGMESGDSG